MGYNNRIALEISGGQSRVVFEQEMLFTIIYVRRLRSSKDTPVDEKRESVMMANQLPIDFQTINHCDLDLDVE